MTTPTPGIVSSLFGLFTGSTGTTTSSTGSLDPFATDTMSSADPGSGVFSLLSANTPVLPAPTQDITLIQWHRLISTATNALTEQLHLSDTQAALLNSELWAELGAWAKAMADLRNKYLNLSKSETKLYQNKLSSSINYNANVIQPYNTFLNGISVLSNAMYTTQQQYANGDLTDAEYNAAVDQWNADVGDLNTQLQSEYNDYYNATIDYNSTIEANNAEIEAINVMRLAQGITELLPLQPLVAIAPLILLPTNLPYGPPAPSVPTVPAALPPVPGVDETSGVSTSIVVSPTTPEEQALLDSIKGSLDAIAAGPIEIYNMAILGTTDEVDLMRQAIADYQNGGDFADYTAARNAYLAYAIAANVTLTPLATDYINALETYNLSLPAINDQIDAFNVTRLALGQDLIPLQDSLIVPTLESLLLTIDIPAGPPAPLVNPLEVTATVLLPPAPNGSITPTNPLVYLSKFYSPIFLANLASISAYNKNLALQNDYRDYIYFTLAGGKTNLLPSNAYIAPFPEIFFNEKADGAAISGVGLTASILGLNSRVLAAVISNALFSASKNIPQEVVDQTLLFALTALEKTSLASALPALSSIGGGLDPSKLTGNPAISAALGLANLKGIEAFLDSGAIEKELAGYLAGAGFSQADIDSLLPSLKAALTIGLLQFGVTQLALALKLPGLLSQVLANLQNVDLKQQLIVAGGKNFGDVFRNEINVLILKTELVKDLLKRETIARTDAQNRINRAINDTLANDAAIRSADDLRSALLRSFSNQGFDQTTSVNLTQQSMQFVDTAQLLPDLDTALNTRDILNSEVVRNLNMQDAVNQALTQSNESKRDFRNALIAQLEQQGSDRAAANNMANQLMLSVQSEALKNSFSIDRINRDLLATSLSATGSGGKSETIASALNGTYDLAPKTELEFREILSRQLQTFGMDRLNAIELAKNAAIAQSGQDPLKGTSPGDFPARDDLVPQFISELSNQFSGKIDGRTATNLGNQLALAIFGPVTTAQYAADEIRRPQSVLNRLNDAYVEARNTHEFNFSREVAKNFSEFIGPVSLSLTALASRINDPGDRVFLMIAGLMYEGMGRKPSNFKEDISVRC